MMRILVAVVLLAGCHAHLGKEYGKAYRAAFEAQYLNLNGPAPLGLDGKEAELSMQKRRQPEGNQAGQPAGPLPMLPLMGGK